MNDQANDSILCGNASDSIYLTFKGGCRKPLTYRDCYRCTGCGGRFHKDCILEHFKQEEPHDWGRQQEREKLTASTQEIEKRAQLTLCQELIEKNMRNGNIDWNALGGDVANVKIRLLRELAQLKKDTHE